MTTDTPEEQQPDSPTPVGSTPEDRAHLLRAVAVVEAVDDQDDDALTALLREVEAYDAVGAAIALATIVCAAGHRDPELVTALLAETRLANL